MTGLELRLWRNVLGLRQDDAAQELGISRRMYIYYETDQWTIPRYIELACEALRVRAEAETSDES